MRLLCGNNVNIMCKTNRKKSIKSSIFKLSQTVEIIIKDTQFEAINSIIKKLLHNPPLKRRARRRHERSLTILMMIVVFISTIIQLISLRNYYVIRDHRKGHDDAIEVIDGSTNNKSTWNKVKVDPRGYASIYFIKI